jgi:hypothetical protein
MQKMKSVKTKQLVLTLVPFPGAVWLLSSDLTGSTEIRHQNKQRFYLSLEDQDKQTTSDPFKRDP